MLSKQEKLKYGQMLRQQMKEKQERKKMEEMQKRGVKPQPNINYEKENVTHSQQKQELQRKFQTIDYGPFGRAGGGAPNRKHDRRQYEEPQHLPTQHSINQLEKYQEVPQQRVRTYEQEGYPYEGHRPTNYEPPTQPQKEEYPPGYNIPPRQPTESYPQHPQYRSPQIDHYRQYAPPEYYAQQTPPQMSQQPHQQYMYTPNIPPQDPLIPTQGNSYQIPQSHKPQPHLYENKSRHLQQSYKQIQQPEQARQRTYENEELADIHKKGGRNLLQLENLTSQQQLIKQKQKLQMQRQLKMQIQETERRKRQEKQRRQREEREEEIKNQQYLERQRQKILDQERKKNDKQRQIIQQNVRNLEERKRLEEQARQKAAKQNELNRAKKQRSPSPKFSEKQVLTRQQQFQVQQDTSSQISSQTIMEKAFNTDVSKEFFQNERRRDQERYQREKNLELVTEEIKKMKEQIDRQNDLFKKEIDKVKQQSEMAEYDKRRAEQEIEQLKQQLRKKMEDDNERLFQALQRQDKIRTQVQPYQIPKRPIPYQEQYQNQYENEQFEIPKARKNEKLVSKQYVVPKQTNQPKYYRKLQQSNVNETGLASLHGESKRIPLNIDDPKLSMSKLSEYARETQYFKNENKYSGGFERKKSAYPVKQSIVEEDEERMESRAEGRKKSEGWKQPKDELDKMLISRQKSRGGWGEMSSVNSDITKQIEDLLRKKENPAAERPSSHLSKAGRQTLSRHGMQYEGGSINTGGQGTLNSVDIDRINNRNEARLNQFRNLGVETINTNNDEEFSKLDQILNKYKQSRAS